jgi:hypothetical protein
MLRRQLLALAGTSLTVTEALAQPAAPSLQKFPDVGATKVRAVVVQARDQRFGDGGKTIDVVLPGR